MGDLAGGTYLSDAFACSTDGAVVFGFGTNSAGQHEAARWTGGVAAGLGFLASGGYNSTIYGCSADGTVACGENVYQGPPNPVPPLPVTQALRWTLGDGPLPLGFLPGNGFLSTARAMSADGAVVVGYALDSTSTYRPSKWTQVTGMVDISGGTVRAQARGVSADGLIIVGTRLGTVGEAFRWTGGSGFEFLGTGAGYAGSSVIDVSADGRRVVGVNSSAGIVRASVWDQGLGWREVSAILSDAGVDVSGWTLTNCLSLSDDGRVLAGNGTNPNGDTEGWVAVIPMRPQCGSADFNQDGDSGTDTDIEDFFACLGGGCCPGCGSADFNGDGDTGTDLDIEAFFRVLGGGSC